MLGKVERSRRSSTRPRPTSFPCCSRVGLLSRIRRGFRPPLLSNQESSSRYGGTTVTSGSFTDRTRRRNRSFGGTRLLRSADAPDPFYRCHARYGGIDDPRTPAVANLPGEIGVDPRFGRVPSKCARSRDELSSDAPRQVAGSRRMGCRRSTTKRIDKFKLSGCNPCVWVTRSRHHD